MVPRRGYRDLRMRIDPQCMLAPSIEYEIWHTPMTSVLAVVLPVRPASAHVQKKIAGQSRFPGKERDAESGNDYFGARYYASTMGRFITPDWASKAEPVPYARLDNPQTLNLYVYLRNNPLAGVDADGHCAKADEATCAQITQDLWRKGTDSSAELSMVHDNMQAQQQGEAQGGSPQGQSAPGTLRPGGPTLVAVALENPKTAVLNDWRGRDVDYGVFELNKNGTLGYRNRDVTIGLHEKLVSGANEKRGICDHSNCSEQGTFEDTQSVQKGHDFSVQRSWTANGVSIGIWNPRTSQPAKYEVLHLQYGSEFTMDYGK